MIERRDLGYAALGLAFAGAFGQSQSASAAALSDGSAALDVVRAFYQASNKGNWGTVDDLFDQYARGRSNSGYFVSPSKSTKTDRLQPLAGAAAGYEEIGGYMHDKSKLLSFLQKRQELTGSKWVLNEASLFSPAKDYVVALVHPDKVDMRGPIPFVHVFWIRTERAEGAILQTRIADFYEIELLKIGMA